MLYEVITEKGLIHVPEGRRLFSLMSVGDNLEVGAHNKRAREHRDRTLREVHAMFPRLLERRDQLVV